MIMDILIVKLGALGDVVNTLPLAVNLKLKLRARIHWLVEPLSFPLLKNHPFIDRVILFNKNAWKNSIPLVIHEIRNQRFDITLDLQRIIKSGMFSLAAKTSRRIGFDRGRCKEMTYLFPFERIPATGQTTHMVDQYLEFAHYLGINSTDVRWDIPTSGTVPFDLPGRYAVLNIGATKPANRWTPGGFSQLAGMLMDRYGLPSVLTGTTEDMNMAEAITGPNDEHIIDLVAKTSVNELADIIAGSSLVVSCDTGPMHLATALNKDVVALFGPADPKRTGPYRGEVVQKDIECMPCNRRRCKNPVCMTSITAHDVIERIEAVLNTQGTEGLIKD